MIKLTVVSYNNEVPAQGLSAVFGRDGGTIGRGGDNFFVLPDPKNHVSRLQAAIKSDGQRHTIENLSQANPVLVNAQELECNRTCSLQTGDEIQIGLYRLRVDAAPAGTDSAAPAMKLQTDHKVPDAARSASPDPHSVPVSPPAIDNQALMQAFLRGAGIPSVTLSSGLTPELMEMIGKLLATSVHGTLDLIGLRALVKREVNAEVTMVVVRNNNPLKFLPDGETVLTQMLRKKMPGFMGPVEAMQDAFTDLHAHQMAVVAGTRAAMRDTLNRLNPEGMDEGEHSLFDAVLPAMRKARMWDRYGEQFQQIAAQAKDDFQGPFGRAFLAAYEQEIERLQSGAQDA